MNKKTIVAAIAAALATPMVANADAILYGKVRVATQYHNRSGVNGVEDTWGMQDQVSRLGVKGDEDLGNGLKAIYKMEFAVNVGDGCDISNANVDVTFNRSVCDSHGSPTQRNSYVGLDGAFGTVLAGRHDTPMKMSTVKLDFFGDTNADSDAAFGVGDYAKGVGLFDSLRVDGTIAYVSPSFAGFTLAGAVVQTNVTNQFDQADDFASAYSLAGMYSNGPWYASLAYESLDPASLGVEALTGASNLPDYTKWRVGLGVLGFNNFSASVIYENRSDIYFLDGVDSDSWELSAAYDFGNTRIKAMYGAFDTDAVGGVDPWDFDTWAIGVQHHLSKRTNVEVIYRQKDVNDVNGVQLAPDDDVFAIQLNHSF